MPSVSDHLSVEELEQRYTSCPDATMARHVQTIWLLARGHSVARVAEITAFGERWIQQLLARYNAQEIEALGDLRRHNGSLARILTPAVLDKLRTRLAEPPDEGGLWSSRRVADFLAGELGLERVGVQRGWEALQAIGWSLRRPRPRSPKAASQADAQAFKKSSRTWSPRKQPDSPSGRSRYLPPMSTGLA